jgi:hypothetical protein
VEGKRYRLIDLWKKAKNLGHCPRSKRCTRISAISEIQQDGKRSIASYQGRSLTVTMACRPAGSARASLTSCPTPSLKENLQRQRSDARTIPDTGCSDGRLAVVSEQDVRMPSANRRSSSRGPCRPCRPPSDPATSSCLSTATTESSDCSRRCRTARCGARSSIQYRAARICHLVVDHIARLLAFHPQYHWQRRLSRRRFYDSCARIWLRYEGVLASSAAHRRPRRPCCDRSEGVCRDDISTGQLAACVAWALADVCRHGRRAVAIHSEGPDHRAHCGKGTAAFCATSGSCVSLSCG